MFPKRGDRSSARHKEPRRPRGHETISLPAFCRRHLICPSCQSVAGNFACGVGQIRSIFPPVLLPHEGRLADRHERWDKDAVDAFGAKDERANKRTAKSCGLDIPTLISSLRDDDLAGDGGKKARLTRESTKETVKTIRAGNAGEAARPVVTEARVLFCFVHGAVGAGCSTRHSPRPLFSVGANEISKLGRDRRRENVAVRL